MRPRRLAGLAAAAVVLAACGRDTPQDVFTPEGEVANDINRLQVPVFAIAGVVGVAVAVIMTIIVVKGRRRYRDDHGDPVQLEGNFKLEIGWTILPALLLLGIAVPTVLTLFEIDDPASAEPLGGMEITVYGQQWWWSYEYETDPGDVSEENRPEVTTANDLVIPAGVRITLNIASRDVIHSFWIPALAGTRDAVPGRVHTLVIQADEPGIYEGQCKEYCGLSHGNMRQRVVALTMSEFETWFDQQQEEQPLLDEDEEHFAGQQLLVTRCSSCHVVDGVVEAADPHAADPADRAQVESGAAPSLTHLMSRGVFAGGMFDLYDPETGEVDRNALEAWIRNPAAVKPMYVDPPAGTLPRGMPDLGLTEPEIDQLVDYLLTLGPPPPIQNDEAPS